MAPGRAKPRTKQTAKKSTGGEAPRRKLPTVPSAPLPPTLERGSMDIETHHDAYDGVHDEVSPFIYDPIYIYIYIYCRLVASAETGVI